MIVISLIGLALAQQIRALPQLQAVGLRYRNAYVGVVGAWGVFFAAALIVVLTGQEPLLVLPPLERFITLVVVALLAWALVSAEVAQLHRPALLVLAGVSALGFVAYLLTVSGWSGVYQTGVSDFNLRFDSGWSLGVALACLGGIAAIVLLYRDIVDAPLKIVFFLIVLLGALYQAAAGPSIGSYPGVVRLSFVLAMGLPLLVMYRMQSAHVAVLRDRVRELQTRVDLTPVRAAVRPVATDSQSAVLIRTLGRILEGATASNMPERIVKAAADALDVDEAFLLRIQDANYADIAYAYDRVLDRTTSGLSLNLSHQPTLANVIENHVPRVLLIDRNREELDDLFTRLDIDRMGTVYLHPLVRDRELKGILGVGLPFTQRELDSHHEELLKSISILAASLMALADEAIETRYLAEDRAIQAMVEGLMLAEVDDDAAVAARQEMQNALKLAREQIAELSKQVMTLTLQLGQERARLADLLSNDEDMLSVSQALKAISEEQQRLREERDALAARVQEAETALTGATATSDQGVINQLVATLEREKEKLTRERDRLQAQLNEMQVQGNLVLPEYMQQIIARMQDEQMRLEQEKSQLADQLVVIQSQLAAMGLEINRESMAPLLARLYEERNALNQRVETLQREKDLLLAERARYSETINRTRESETRTTQLEGDLEHVAQDREAAIRQRERLRAEFDELQRKLDAVKEHRARLLAQVSGYEIELAEAREEQARLRAQIQELSDARSDLMYLRDKLLAERQALEAAQHQQAALASGDTARLQAIIAESTAQLQAMVDELAQAKKSLERELSEARLKLDEVTQERDRLSISLNAVKAAAGAYDTKNPDLFVGLIQELRTPLTSLIGYVDLLLNESAGILGEMQRKFLQRVSANVLRLQTMIDELVQIANLDRGNHMLRPMPVSVVTLIEDAITNASMQFREKGLRVNLDLDDEIPLLNADKDALTQVISELLTNAYLVTPPGSEVRVTARMQPFALRDEGVQEPCVLVSVEDRGGGIQPEDTARVFVRKYRVEHPLIQGLGDTGVGMSVARTLVEAHGGRLWLESKPNVGTIFSFVLPLSGEVETSE
jgi:signal transduction histidine kinase